MFDASQHACTQHFATSADGTQVPYFLLAPKDMPLDGSQPTLLDGYGGFEISLTPAYIQQLPLTLAPTPTPNTTPTPYPLPQVLGRSWRRVARARRRQGHRQHPRRRRVRPALAPGGAAREAAQGVRGLRGGRA